MSMSTEEFSWLRIQGPLSVVPMTPKDLRGESVRAFILMGPTGSGKSSFIESLSSDQQLSISNDTLESVTQLVTCYKVANLECVLAFARYILIDTPGFLDPNLSERRITRMVTETLDRLRENAETMMVSILYFQSITDVRMGASKRDAVKLLRAFVAPFQPTGINVVTTMWNNLTGAKQITDANRRFEDMQQEIFTTGPFNIAVTRFDLDQHSALNALNAADGGWFHVRYRLKDVDPQYRALACSNLLERITNVQHQLLNLAYEKESASSPAGEDVRLLGIIRRDEKVAFEVLDGLLDDLYELDLEVYQYEFPNLPSPRPPRGSNISLATRFKNYVSSLTAVLKRGM